MRRQTKFAVAALAAFVGLASACSSREPAPAAKEQPAAPRPVTAEERVRWYQACWAAFNENKMADLKQCYTPTAASQDGMGMTRTGPDAITAASSDFIKSFPDARGEAQLILLNANQLAGVYLLKGTNAGPLQGPDNTPAPATNKKIGLLYGHVAELEPNASKVTKELSIFDGGTFAAQLGLAKSGGRPYMERGEASPRVVVAKNDAMESNNVAVEKATLDAWNKRDSATLYASYADDFVGHGMTDPKDTNKTQMGEMDKGFWKAFSDARVTPSSIWGAGDYVVVVGNFEGTNDADFPLMQLKKTGKKVSAPYITIDRFENGKIKEGWAFYDGTAFAAQLGLK